MVEVIGSSPTAPTKNKRASRMACSFVIGGDFGASTRRNRNLKPYANFNAPSSVILRSKLTLDGNKLPRTRLLNAHHEKGYACGYCALWAIRDFAVSRKREPLGKNLLRKLTLDGNKLPRTRLLNAHHEKGVRLWRTLFRGGR